MTMPKNGWRIIQKLSASGQNNFPSILNIIKDRSTGRFLFLVSKYKALQSTNYFLLQFVTKHDMLTYYN